MQIKWKLTKNVYFTDLELLDTFKIVGGRGAIYMKVSINKQITNEELIYGQLELATGKVFKPTSSPLVLVDVEMNVETPKPSIY